MKEKVEKHFAYIQVTLKVTRHKTASGMTNVREDKVRGPWGVTQSTSRTVVHDPDIVLSLGNVEIMYEAKDIASLSESEIVLQV